MEFTSMIYEYNFYNKLNVDCVQFFRMGTAIICIEGYIQEFVYRKSYATIEEIRHDVFD